MGLRRDIIEWIDEGNLAAGDFSRAMRLAGITPALADWRKFFDLLALWLGVIFLALGVIFFFAYNWDEMSRFSKFALVEIAMVISMLGVWRFDLDSMPGKALLLFVALLVGAFLALVGQTYQTGADSFELFGAWAAMILPLVIVGCFAPLWLIWVALANLGIVLYFETFGGFFHVDEHLWLLFSFNSVILCLGELAWLRRLPWLRGRWSIRILAVLPGAIITFLMLLNIFTNDEYSSSLGYIVWFGIFYFVYTKKIFDLFVLSGLSISLTIVLSALVLKLLSDSWIGSYLLITFIVIGLSIAGSKWLKFLAAREKKQ